MLEQQPHPLLIDSLSCGYGLCDNLKLKTYLSIDYYESCFYFSLVINGGPPVPTKEFPSRRKKFLFQSRLNDLTADHFPKFIVADGYELLALFSFILNCIGIGIIL